MVRFWIYFKDGVRVFLQTDCGVVMIPTCLVSKTGRVGLPYEWGWGLSPKGVSF